MIGLNGAPTWSGTSSDPNDEQFGDVVEPRDPGRWSVDAYDVALLGEPFDDAVIGRKGASRGPAALRDALAGVKTHHFGNAPVGSIVDVGDVTIGADSEDPIPSTITALQRDIRSMSGRLYRSDVLPVFLGGDNSLTFPNAAPLLDSGSLGCINFDAHLDVREVRDDATSGTPYRQLFDAGLDAYACVGARHFETSTTYAAYVDEQGGEIITAEAVGDDPLAAVDRAVDAMGDVDAVYVSVDLDVLDATAAPGVSAPTPGGLATRELFRMLRELASEERVAGFEVVECAPPLDSDGRTAAAGARAIAHFLSGYAAEGSA